jgi:hypothetical protein
LLIRAAATSQLNVEVRDVDWPAAAASVSTWARKRSLESLTPSSVAGR